LANFQNGLNAYNKQDYAAALKEWQPLAKQGNADAQNNLGAVYANNKGTAIFSGSTSEVMSCPKLKIGFVSPLN
jgi:TPR repeat protein